ncbi:DUF3606 domain-containing protein [Roseateles amylovorans]|jgi:Protein of unknown function (DUF3606)|uniref:DUF3606 domain-containing protein n=1 Tax=Roseateles amylovorans TaxID=2978473 RepID=A0ABY6B5P7_9BURK|nr:DUF3606 domain-containing protein [Roseateles amylovorans]UXH80579.1 DUF3606 domain-containing protein [Roseateles amylovorans]
MPEETSNTHGSDRNHVNVLDDYELRYWGERFGVSDTLVKHAVDAVGTSAKSVEEWLQAHR